MKKTQLILLHFAGGNCYSFQFLIPWLRKFDVLSPELPGRGRRYKESLLTDFDLAAEDLFNQVSGRLHDGPFIIYGHSMGAYLALKLGNLLEGRGRRPQCLVVSGNAGPGIRDGKRRYLLQGDAFVEELEKLGGVPREVIENEELFGFFEPILRADFEISERNTMAFEAPSNAPLCALMGSREPKVDKITNWGRFTSSRFAFEIMEGDHFFIYHHPERIAALLQDFSQSLI